MTSALDPDASGHELAIPGFRSLRRAWENASSVTFFAMREERSREETSREVASARVILKVGKARRPPSSHRTALQRDHDMSVALASTGAVVACLEHGRNEGIEYIVLADEGLRPLGEALLATRPSGFSAIQTLTRLVEAVERLHQANTIHTKINPGTIWLDRDAATVRLSDLAAARSWDEKPITYDDWSDVDPRYLSPEQTGRLDHGVDARADLYQIGLVAYELLCGRPAFDDGDALRLIHAQLTQLPPPPRTQSDAIPEVLSRLVMKLLSKYADDRYQTASGLKSDLQRCLKEWQDHGDIKPFALGEADTAPPVLPSGQLFGRDEELAIMHAVVERAGQGSAELVLVSGVAGSGKSSLVRSVEREARRAGLYIHGKIDQQARAAPYAAFTQAFRQVVELLVSRTESELSVWRKQLIDALGANGQVAVKILPELASIIGLQDKISALPPTEERARFHHVFRNLLSVFAKADRPLILFLDDLQWADPASMDLLRALVTDHAVAHLTIIGASRLEQGPRAAEIEDILFDSARSGTVVTRIGLHALAISEIDELLRTTFPRRLDETMPLAQIIMVKTGGNPFFVNQFIAFLHQQRLLRLDGKTGLWTWNAREIAEKGITDSVLELMSQRLTTLPALACSALSVGACIGSSFDIGDIQPILNAAPDALEAALIAAEQAGLVLSAASPAGAKRSGESADFSFLHDRVQQAAYALIPADGRAEMHLRIGRSLLTNWRDRSTEPVPFAVLDNVNAGIELIQDPRERADLAAANLAAALRARDLAAFAAARNYFDCGLRLLNEQCWERQYELTLDLHLGRFECEYVLGHFENANALFFAILGQARSASDKAKAFYLKILLNSGLDRSEEAVAVGREALLMFGERLPKTPSRILLFYELLRVRLLLRRQRAEQLQQLPRTTEPDIIATLRLLMSICPAAYFRNTELMALAALRIMAISLRSGTDEASSFGYVLYGLILGGLLGKYREGQAFGELAVRVCRLEAGASQQCKILTIFAGFVNFWSRPIGTSISMLHESLGLSFDVGDIQYANYSMLQIVFLRIARGDPLGEIDGQCKAFGEPIERSRDWFATTSLEVRRRFIGRLTGSTDLATAGASGGRALGGRALGSQAAEDDLIARLDAAGNTTARSYYRVGAAQTAYLFGDLERALHLSDLVHKELNSVTNQITIAEHYFFRVLILVAARRAGMIRRSLRFRRALAECRRKIGRWATHAPDNFGTWRLVVEAEVAALKGRHDRAETLFETAAEAARAAGAHNIEALACELAAHSCLRRSGKRAATGLLNAARDACERWGARAKVRQLNMQLRELAATEPSRSADGRDAARTPPSVAQAREGMQLDAILRLTAELSAAKGTLQTLANLVRLVLESIGGQRAMLLSVADGAFELVADVKAAPQPDANEPPAAAGGTVLPEAMLSFAVRTTRPLIVEDARSDERFAASDYVVAAAPRSVFCVAIVKDGAATAVVYVENCLVPGAFAPARIQPALLVIQQIAAVLENQKLQSALSDNMASLDIALKNVEVLERIRHNLAKFVPRSLQRIIEDNPLEPDFSAHPQDVTVMFLDIAGYTSMSERMGPRDLQALVETYFSNYLDAIHRHDGDISEIAGDGLMIIFSASKSTSHAAQAVHAALAIREHTHQLNERRDQTTPNIIINTGINSGEILVGSNKIGDGANPRWIYTGTGYAVNLAARICSAATDGAILVSDETAARVSALFELEALGPRKFKGISRDVALFRVNADTDRPLNSNRA